MTDDSQRETRLVRSRDGGTYHVRDCVRAGKVVSWIWAEEQLGASKYPSMTIAAVTSATGVKACKHCDPLGHIEQLEKDGEIGAQAAE